MLTLLRVGSSDHGTFGVLREGAIPFAVTMEPPWTNNEQRMSCIPPGRYVCRRVQSQKFGETFEVTDVPGRSHILFHAGNTLDDTEGCIMVAEEFGGTDRLPIIASSKRGYGEFMAKQVGKETFELEIMDITTR
jgi:hypothetical protein